MTTDPSYSLDDINIHELVTSRRQVAVLWSIEDVQAVRPDLSDNQSWDVLQRCIRVHHCEVGFTWLLIETVADDLFPHADTTEEEATV
ncbi:MAG: hypothetical protein BroJett003_01510 [Planctomycetota bacterium]|nr:MAG: hypothetical protein BroJett003_01510 [Planctomycetota bacterium]